MTELDAKDESISDHLTQQGDSDLSSNGTDHRECGLNRSDQLSGATSGVHTDLDRAYARFGVSSAMLAQLDHQHLSCQHSEHSSSPKNDMHHSMAAQAGSSQHDSGDALGQSDSLGNPHCVSDGGREMEGASLSVSSHHEHSMSSAASNLVSLIDQLIFGLAHSVPLCRITTNFIHVTAPKVTMDLVLYRPAIFNTRSTTMFRLVLSRGMGPRAFSKGLLMAECI
jgi:hypothetical protein